ncbi:uncharacterized protein BDW47DRAFT_101932 [Aspergillus candidus]|uniref:Uncharacterized protein n=1 Tax=Aspergillus candidus TaxID=41067 RepID=A0A2I2FIC7_ASPCN|nr:hypothetical protein BDW47DRAFT_101932 [Aspergillus candidus]PLB40387.1 hypothetical protein BDW47DRAFT_101932 [Aspergillus candidus]
MQCGAIGIISQVTFGLCGKAFLYASKVPGEQVQRLSNSPNPYSNGTLTFVEYSFQ